MRKCLGWLLFLLVLGMVPVHALAEGQDVEYIVKYKENLPAIIVGQETERLDDVGMAVIKAESKAEAAALIKEMNERPDVEFVEKSMERRVSGTVSVNDPLAPRQWHLSYLDLDGLWRSGTPQKEVVIAVIDSGIAHSHPDLQGKIAAGGYNFLANNDQTEDTFGHGTAVSGLIAAGTNNGVGIAGVAGPFPIKILPLKVIKDDGKGVTTDVVRAINYAIEKQVDFINISLGADQPSVAEQTAIRAAMEQGIMVVASSGNESSSDLYYPSSYEEVISVGSIGQERGVSAFSNHNSQVDITAPGEKIITLGLNGSYVEGSGTSFAAPIVTGVAAVIKSAHPEVTNEEIRRWLYRSSVDQGNPGRDDMYGYGVINPHVAAKIFQTETWRKKESVAVDKQWNVRFNVNVVSERLAPNDILVIDGNGQTVPVALLQGGPQSIRIQPPVGGYEAGKHYEIYISSGIQAVSGKKTSVPLRIPFSVK